MTSRNRDLTAPLECWSCQKGEGAVHSGGDASWEWQEWSEDCEIVVEDFSAACQIKGDMNRPMLHNSQSALAAAAMATSGAGNLRQCIEAQALSRDSAAVAENNIWIANTA